MHARLLPLIVRLFDFFTIAFSALFPLLNPFGSAMLFLGMVGPADAIVYRRLARRVALYTVLFLMVVDLAGALVLTFFGISLPVIQVAGGLVLASMGWTLLNQPDAPETEQTAGTFQFARGTRFKSVLPFYLSVDCGTRVCGCDPDAGGARGTANLHRQHLQPAWTFSGGGGVVRHDLFRLRLCSGIGTQGIAADNSRNTANYLLYFVRDRGADLLARRGGVAARGTPYPQLNRSGTFLFLGLGR